MSGNDADGYLFAGLKVIDAATVIAAPAAAMMLADFGADVVKIERPGSGDMLRAARPVPHESPAAADYMWQLDGRNKRSLTLNLKSPEGMEILRRLAAGCDVFITNHPYAARQSLGITYDDLRPLNKRMIYASLTAYGERGPERARKGFDQLAYWARSGLMDLMRSPDAVPIQGLSGMGDHPTGVALYAAIVTALLRRERTGEGGMAHTSLLANGLWSNASITQGVMAGGDSAGFRARRTSPPVTMRVYRCADGRHLQLNMVRNPELVARLFDALDAADLLQDERFATPRRMRENRAALGDLVQEIIEARSSDDWLARFDEAGVPANRIAIVEEKPTDAQILENDMATAPADPAMGVPLLVRHPVKATGVPHVEPRRPPGLGEHSAEILRELGYDEERIEAFRAQGVI